MISDGVTIGLQLWLIFLTIFFLLGYPPVLSIGLGAIAALAGRTITDYVKAISQAPPAEKSDKKDNPLKLARNRLTRWRGRKEGQQSLTHRDKKRGGRKHRRSLSSKR